MQFRSTSGTGGRPGVVKRRGGLVVGLVTVAALASGCGGGGGSHAAAAKATPAGGAATHGDITLGVLAPVERTGPIGDRGRDLVDGAKMATAEVNAKGGVLGHKLALNVVDDACVPEVAYEAAKALGEGSGVAGVVGGACDAAAAREVPIVDSAGIPFLVTTANAASLVTPDLTNTYFMNGTIYEQALSAVFWMNYQQAQRLAVVDDTSADSQALAKNAIKLIDEAPKLVSLQTVQPGQTDMDVVAKAAVLSKPNFIYWTGSAQGGGALAKALKKAGYKGTFTASAASESADFLLAAGPGGADGAYITATSTAENTPTAAKWLGQFKAEYGHAPGLDALQAYDAVRTLAQTIKQSKSTDDKKMLDNLLNLDTGFTNFLGVVRFSRDHTLLYDNRVILQVKNGKFTWKRSLRTDSLQ